MDALAGDAVLPEEGGQAIGAVLGAGEDERILDRSPAQQREQQLRLETLGHGVDLLPHAGRGGDGRGQRRR